MLQDIRFTGRALFRKPLIAALAIVTLGRFDFPGGADAWVPLKASARSERDNKDLAVIDRLGPGATLAQLRGDLRDIARFSDASRF